MPTYAYECDACDDYFHIWESIHADAQTVCGKCGGHIVRVIERVATYGVGPRGAQTRDSDAMDARLDRDRPAYKALRAEGHQPQAVLGAHDLTQRATDPWYIKTGGKVSVPEARTTEINEMLAEGAMSTWSPVEERHKTKENV